MNFIYEEQGSRVLFAREMVPESDPISFSSELNLREDQARATVRNVK